MSFSDASDADPRSQIFSILRDSLTWSRESKPQSTLAGGTYQDVVWLEVCVENVTLTQQAQAKKHLLGIGTNGFQVNANIPSKFLQYFSEIDADEGSEREAQAS